MSRDVTAISPIYIVILSRPLIPTPFIYSHTPTVAYFSARQKRARFVMSHYKENMGQSAVCLALDIFYHGGWC
jgi:hypothetical protein